MMKKIDSKIFSSPPSGKGLALLPLIRRRFKGLGGILLYLCFTLAIASLLTLYTEQLPLDIREGMIATKDIKADQNYEIIDQESTDKLKEEAQAGVLQAYDFDNGLSQEVAGDIDKAFSFARKFLSDPPASDSLPGDVQQTLRTDFADLLGVTFEDATFDYLHQQRFAESLGRALQELVRKVMAEPIVHDRQTLLAQREKGIVIHRLQDPDAHSEFVVGDVESVKDLTMARNAFSELPASTVMTLLPDNFKNQEAQKQLGKLAALLVRSNMVQNLGLTESRRAKAREDVKAVIIKIQTGESIIRAGDRFAAQQIKVIEGIRRAKGNVSMWMVFLGAFVFLHLLFPIAYYFPRRFIRKFNPSRTDLIFLGSNLLFLLILLRLLAALSPAIVDVVPFPLELDALNYLIPIAGGAMLVRFVINSETALVFGMMVSLIAGLFLEHNLDTTIYYLLGSIFAAHVVAHVDRRMLILKSGVLTGGVNALLVISLKLSNLLSVTATTMDWEILLTSAIFAFMGGILASVYVMVVTPIVEALFHYTTDITLLELANLNHPLLKEMVVRAPGTYHHSHLVGILAESGAQAIGANPLFARVACYYHDIGKMKKPLYFIENQKGGENRHDKLAPSMSALIIAAHVKDGLDMAHKYKLPVRIADIIPQHQGTKLIAYFYNKAKQLATGENEMPAEKDYRYPGPKPQTREAGIIMLADTVEAAVRSLAERSPDKIQMTVQKLVNQHFVDEQLDECELTLKDLHLIAQAFIKTLNGVYHQRIEYPEEDLPKDNIHPIKQELHVISHNPQPTSTDQGAAPEAPGEDKKGIKRLGL